MIISLKDKETEDVYIFNAYICCNDTNYLINYVLLM